MPRSNTVTTFPRGFDGTNISMVASTTGNFDFQYPISASLGNPYNTGTFYSAPGGRSGPRKIVFTTPTNYPMIIYNASGARVTSGTVSNVTVYFATGGNESGTSWSYSSNSTTGNLVVDSPYQCTFTATSTASYTGTHSSVLVHYFIYGVAIYCPTTPTISCTFTTTTTAGQFSPIRVTPYATSGANSAAAHFTNNLSAVAVKSLTIPTELSALGLEIPSLRYNCLGIFSVSGGVTTSGSASIFKWAGPVIDLLQRRSD